MPKKTKMIYFLAGVSFSAIASPLGLTAAILAPVFLVFSKEAYFNHIGRHADPSNLAWVIAGVASFVTLLRLAAIKL